MPSLAMALRIFAIAFSVTVMPLAVACGVSIAVVILSPLQGWFPYAQPPHGLRRGLPSFAASRLFSGLPGLKLTRHPSRARAPAPHELFRFGSYWLRRFLLLFPVADRGADRVFCEDRAVNLYRREREFLHDLGVLDREGFVDRLAFDPLGRQRGRGDGRAAAEGLELGVFDDVGFAIDLDLQLHDVAAFGRSDQAGAYVGAGFVHRADIARVVVVIDDFVAI